MSKCGKVWYGRLGLLGMGLLLVGCSYLPRDNLARRPDTERLADTRPRQALPEAAAKAPAAESAKPEPTVNAQLFPGSGSFVAPPRPRQTPAEQAGGNDLNFTDADLREVATLILGEILRVNYFIDPQIKGVVTFRVAHDRALQDGDLLSVLEMLLEANGAVLVQEGNLYKVLPAANAAKSGLTPSAANPKLAGYQIQIVPLQFIAATEMQKILEPLAAQNAIVRVDPVRNLLMLAGSQRELQNLLETVRVFDVDWLKGMSVGFFPLKNTEVATLKTELDAIFGEQTPLGGTLKIIPVERMNAVLVVTTQPQYLREMRIWVERLDQIGANGGSERRLYVYQVQNGKAEHLAEMLSGLFGEGSSQTASTPSVAPGRVATSLRSPGSANNSVSSTPTGLGSLTGSTAASNPGGSLFGGNQTRDATRAASTPAANATPAVSSTPGSGVSAAPVAVKAELFGADGVKVIADSENNALLIMASPAEYQKIESALGKLDNVPLQVLIEASIIEVNLEGDLNYGVQWFLNNRVSGYDGALDLGLGLPTASLSSFSYALSKDGDVRFLLRMLEAESKLNVISTPSIMVRDNQTAKISVGRQVPVRTGQTTSGVGTTTELIQYRDTGVLLEVTPRVNSSGLVLMEINQEVSSVDQTQTSSIDSPTINQRAIQSTVAVQSGETIVLGGLIQDDRSLGKSGVTGLYALPVVGPLFGQTNQEANRTELLVLLTPRAVRNLQEARDVTQELRSKLRGLGP